MFGIAFVLMMQTFFPLFADMANETIRLSVVNSSLQAEEFTVRAITADGQQIHRHSVVLGPGAQTVLTGGMLGSALSSASSIKVESASNLFSSALLFSASEVMAAVEGVKAPSRTVHLPGVRVRTGFVELDAVDTNLLVVNTSTETTSVIASFFNMDGVFRKAVAVSLPAGGSRKLRASEVLRNESNADVHFEGRVVIQSDIPIAAWQRVERPLSWSGIRGRGPDEPQAARSGLYLAPFFVFGGGYQSTLSLVNPTNEPLTLQVSGLSNDGRALGEVAVVTLRPGQTLASRVDELLKIPVIAIYPPPVITGSIRVSRPDLQSVPLVATLTIVHSSLSSQLDRQSEMVYWLSAPQPGVWTVPYVETSNLFYSGFAVSNPNEWLPFSTPITIEEFNPAGVLRAKTTYGLSPGETFPALVGAGLSQGYLRVRSEYHIGVLGTLGSHDGRLLESMPAGR